MTKKQRKLLARILIAFALFIAAVIVDASHLLAPALGETGALYASFTLFLIPYLIVGHDVLRKAARNIIKGRAFDENFLMSVATIGAFAMIAFPESDPHMAEGAAVMLFYQVGELFESYAVGKSRKSIAEMMDIAPEFANLETDGRIEEVDPEEVLAGSIIVVRPGERIPIDGIVIEGASQLDASALTGESVPRRAERGTSVVSGCVNMTGTLRIRTTKRYSDSTVSRILELVENASEKKARTENFITRFARVYTPIVCIAALAIAIAPPLLGIGAWNDWILRGLTFLVVSCPCALVISVPLSFFGGIGGASRLGILVKGSSYLEALAKVETIVFDKTGTLTSGSFEVVAANPATGTSASRLLRAAAHAEAYSTHPIAVSILKACDTPVDVTRVKDAAEKPGLGVRATVDGQSILVGNEKLIPEASSYAPAPDSSGTVLHVSIDGEYAGSILLADALKPDAAIAVAELRQAGVRRCIMLTGDRENVARSVASRLGIEDFRADLLPQEKVEEVEKLLGNAKRTGTLAFVGDGINDAPVLMRADVGIAMGALGSDAAIEAADIVLMDDKPSSIAKALRVARRTVAIVRQNIVFAIGVKALILILAALGIANMWLAVFGDVGVAVLAILNAMRAMDVRKA